MNPPSPDPGMVITAAGLAGRRVEVRGRSPVLRHAAEELRSHLGRLPATADSEGGVVLAAGRQMGDGFSILRRDGDVVVDGQSPRGALNGVYWLLEQVGFAWVEPGERGVAFVPGCELLLGHHRRRSPRFAARTLVLGQDALHDDWREWMEWASRNRLNRLFFHDTPPSRTRPRGTSRPATAAGMAADGGGWLFERWQQEGEEIVAQAARRGMGIEFGGHHLARLIPRSELNTHPVWAIERNGERDPRHNFCLATREARERLQAGARRFLRRFPGADVYHLWADDIRGGGWCGCRECASLSPSDQALRATNLVAEVLAWLAPRARVAHLAYHDTAQPPRTLAPADNVDLLWAPRERCYAHDLFDRDCGRNAPYAHAFEGLMRRWPDPARVAVFEYYSDAILFKGLAPPHLAVLPRDAAAYQRAGAAQVQDLVVADRPWVGPPWHAWWFARCAWGGEEAKSGGRSALARFCAAAYGDAASTMQLYYRAQEVAYRLLLDLRNLEPNPLGDVLDFGPGPRAGLRAKVREAQKTSEMLSGLARLLEVTPGGAAGDRLDRERVQAAFVAAMARVLAARAATLDAELDGREARAAKERALAQSALDEVEAWDAAHNTPAYAAVTSRVRRAMRR